MVTGFEYEKLQTQKALVKAINRLATVMQAMVDNTKLPSIQLNNEQMSELEKIVKGIQKTT